MTERLQTFLATRPEGAVEFLTKHLGTPTFSQLEPNGGPEISRRWGNLTSWRMRGYLLSVLVFEGGLLFEMKSDSLTDVESDLIEHFPKHVQVEYSLGYGAL